MDCVVHGVTKSRTQLNDFHFLTTVCDHWEDHSLYYMDLHQQSNVSAFDYAVQVGHNFSSKEQASFHFMAAVIDCLAPPCELQPVPPLGQTHRPAEAQSTRPARPTLLPGAQGTVTVEAALACLRAPASRKQHQSN